MEQLRDAVARESTATSAGIDLSLRLVRSHLRSAVARAIARRVVVPPHRDSGQAQCVEAPLRQHFLRLVGTTPTAYRRAYRGTRNPRAAPPLVDVAS